MDTIEEKKRKILIAVVVILLLVVIYFLKFTFRGNPSSPMFQRLEKAMIEFSPDLVLVEGGYNTFEGNRERAIQDGESAFATYLAKQAEKISSHHFTNKWNICSQNIHQKVFKNDSLEDILTVVYTFLPELINNTNWQDVDIKAVNYTYTKEDGALYPIYMDVYNYRNIYLVDLYHN